MQNKISALLGFSRKSGALKLGAKLVLLANDISPKSVKEIRFICDKNNIKAEILPMTIEEISAAIGRRAGILALEDEGFASAILKNI